jgi:transposase-like protein
LDAEHKLVLEVVNGKRTEKNTKLLVQKTAERLNFKTPRLMTSDEYKPYKKAILKAFGVKRVPKRTGKRGRPKGACYRPKPGLVYATVHKTRVKGRVVNID